MSTQGSSRPSSSRWVTLLGNVWRAISVPLAAVFLAALIGAVILWISGASPLLAYSALIEGAFGSPAAIQRTLEKATPLVLSGLAVAFAFKAGLFNIGAQGQLLLGALAAAVVGFGVKGLPPLIHVPLALLVGGLAGALYGAIPGALKAYTGAHEVITTIMLNYIAINITDYFADGPLKDATPGNVVARTPLIEESARIGTLGSIPVGFIIAVIAAIACWWLLWHTTIGYEIRTVGLSPHAARYAGMKVARTVILTMVISGFLAGIGGGIETQGVVGRYQPGFNVGLGFDGITIALLGKTHPFGVIPAAILVGAMDAGASQMQFDAGVAKEITDVIQALILFFVAADMIVRWVFRMRAAEEEMYFRLHYFDAQFLPPLENYSNISVSDQDDIQEVLCGTDILITDYSSIYFDYLLLDRPVIFTPFDLDDYLQNDREFHFRYEDVTPGPLAKNWTEVMNFIEEAIESPVKYKEQRQKIRDFFFQHVDGNSSKRVIDAIYKAIR